MSARPIQPDELILLAEKLVPADAGRGRPRTVELRRAVSTAYYALFHELISQATTELIGTPAGAPQRSQVSRWFAHSDITALAVAATGTSAGGPSRALATALGTPSPELVRVAEAFVALQSARHDCDYNHEYDIKRADTLSWIATARDAVSTVRRLQAAGDASLQRFLRLMVGAVRIAKVR